MTSPRYKRSLAASLSTIFLPQAAVSLARLNSGALDNRVVDLLDYSYPLAFWAGIWLIAKPFFQSHASADAAISSTIAEEEMV